MLMMSVHLPHRILTVPLLNTSKIRMLYVGDKIYAVLSIS
jgi:hypothetical protein